MLKLLPSSRIIFLGVFLGCTAMMGVALYMEHVMELVMGVADHIAVLNFGKKIAEGTPEEVQNNPAVQEAYLGSGGDEKKPAAAKKAAAKKKPAAAKKAAPKRSTGKK